MLHCMAFAKMQNQLEMEFCLFILKLDINFQVLKNSEFTISAISAWAANCQEQKQVYGVTSNHLDQ